MKIRLRRHLMAAWSVVFSLSVQAQLTFTNVSLPPVGAGSSGTMAQFGSDGRWLAATSNQLYQQTVFGADAYTSVGSFAGTLDPSFLAVSPDGSWVAAGAGGYNTLKPVYQIGATGGVATSMSTLSNVFSGVWRSSSELLLSAVNNTTDSRVLRLQTNGVLSTVVSNAGYSGAITLNVAGDLFVANGANNDIRKFDFATLTNTIQQGTILDFSAGLFVTNLGVSGSLAFDSQGDLLAGGWQTNVFYRLDLGTYAVETYNPKNIAAGASGYSVIAGNGLIGAYDAFNPSALYIAQIPEPVLPLLLIVGGAVLMGGRRLEKNG